MPYLEFYKMKNEKEITDKTKKDLKRYYKYIELYDIIIPVLETFHEKPITKRISTKIKSLLPKNYNIYYDNKSYSFCEIYISYYENNKNESFNFHIGYKNNPIITSETISDLKKQCDNI